MATNFGMLLAAVMVGSVGASVHLSLSVSVVSDLLPPQHVRCSSPAVSDQPSALSPIHNEALSTQNTALKQLHMGVQG